MAIPIWMALFMLHPGGFAQNDPDKEKKEKTEKPAKPPKEKPEKAPKEKPEKAPKEKTPKPPKEKADKAEKSADEDDGGGDDKEKKASKEKKGRDKSKSDQEPSDPSKGVPKTANESFHANNADSTTKHGYAVPCARYRRGTMEFIDKNNTYITIRRKARKEIQINSNRGIRETKNRTITRDQHLDKQKTKIRKDKHGKIKDKGNKIVFKIKWTGDCEYTLTYVRSLKPTKFKKGWEMNCRITKCYEDYYDCDCDMHDIMQYGSIRKKLTKSEIAANERKEAELLRAKEAEALAEQQEKERIAAEEAAKRAAEDEVFGPIKRIKPAEGEEPPKQADPNIKAPGDGPAPSNGKTTPAEKHPAPKDPAPKTDKEPKDKSDKTPKEKTGKAPKEKKDKTPKEKKVKAPNEKKEKAPKEKPAKEPKEKPEKEPKEKPAKEPKAKPDEG